MCASQLASCEMRLLHVLRHQLGLKRIFTTDFLPHRSALLSYGGDPQNLSTMKNKNNLVALWANICIKINNKNFKKKNV